MENINKVPISSYILENIQRIVLDFKICYNHIPGVLNKLFNLCHPGGFHLVTDFEAQDNPLNIL